MKSQKERILSAAKQVTVIAGVEYAGGGVDKFGKGIPLIRINAKDRVVKKPKHEPKKTVGGLAIFNQVAHMILNKGIKEVKTGSNLERKLRHCLPRGTNFYNIGAQ